MTISRRYSATQSTLTPALPKGEGADSPIPQGPRPNPLSPAERVRVRAPFPLPMGEGMGEGGPLARGVRGQRPPSPAASGGHGTSPLMKGRAHRSRGARLFSAQPLLEAGGPAPL